MKAVSLFAIVNLLTKIRTKNSFRKAILVVFYGEGKIGGKLSFSRVVRRSVQTYDPSYCGVIGRPAYRLGVAFSNSG